MKTFEYLGQHYREAPEPAWGPRGCCEGCAFNKLVDDCHDAGNLADQTFGGNCNERGVIYLRVDGENPTAAT